MPAVPERYHPRNPSTVVHPAWTRDAVIYQINTRQYTAGGTLRAAAQHIPRLADLGVGILWLMPIHEIGAVNRKGTLGSPYAVRDYYSVSAELGELDDLRHFVELAHDHGLKVILDWVANHTAWDNPLVTEHPEWYDRDPVGGLRPTPWWDWNDVIDLDYRQPGLRQYMTEAMTFWVREADVDGFRCDVAGFVPKDFWETARGELEAIKEVFLLAEWEARDLHHGAFDASYAWSWNEAMHRVATARADVSALHVYYAWNEKAYPRDAMRMTFVSNHDKNAWEGTEYEQFGDALEAAIALSVVGEGIPMIYSGQEAGNTRRLPFFEREPITWQVHPMADFYRRLIALRRSCPPLDNGAWGARMHWVPNSDPTRVLSFVRDDGTQRVFAVFNFSPATVETSFAGPLYAGTYREPLENDHPVTVDGEACLELPAWSFRVLVGDSDRGASPA
jgi:glycosidase